MLTTAVRAARLCCTGLTWPEALPVTSDEEGPLSVTRGSGGPPGERNGQYRHGERTKAVIAEQQKFSALLTMLRVRLT